MEEDLDLFLHSTKFDNANAINSNYADGGGGAGAGDQTGSR
jgi:hypothetical protein